MPRYSYAATCRLGVDDEYVHLGTGDPTGLSGSRSAGFRYGVSRPERRFRFPMHRSP